MDYQLDKETYIGIVKYTLESMVKLSKEDPTYDIKTDANHYFEYTIKTEAIITMAEFIELCKEAGIE